MISVCMTSHNAERYIRLQIESILSQLGDLDELIISDDGSTDGTLAYLQSITDSRVRVIHYNQERDYSHRKHVSFYYASANFGHALKAAKGDYIFLSDNDDIWYPNKVAKCIEALKDADIVCHNFDTIDENGNIIQRAFLDSKQYNNLNFLNYLRLLPFRGCCLAYNRKVYDLTMPIPMDTFEHDCYIGMKAVIHG